MARRGELALGGSRGASAGGSNDPRKPADAGIACSPSTSRRCRDWLAATDDAAAPATTTGAAAGGAALPTADSGRAAATAAAKQAATAAEAQPVGGWGLAPHSSGRQQSKSTE